MNIAELLDDDKILYKVIDKDKNTKILKVAKKLHILCIEEKGNQFVLERDFFDYLDGSSLPYCLLLQDTLNKKNYYIELEKSHNWIKACFETCDKEKIYLGKQVLNSQISDELLRKKLIRLK